MNELDRTTAGLLGACALLLASLGCTTSTAEFVGGIYYVYGPEDALDASRFFPVSADERALVELERAVALLELGEYSASDQALSRAGLVFEVESAVGPLAGSSRSPWVPEAHEQVLMQTLRIVNNLALQELPDAAEAADRAVERIAGAQCRDCDWIFTRIVAALAYESVGRWSVGLTVLGGVRVEGPAGDVVDAIKIRLNEGATGRQPAGLAPPPVPTDRELTVLGLLGRGPTKAPTRLELDDGTKLRFAEYVPHEPRTMASVTIEGAGDDPVASVELSNVEFLAARSLQTRTERVRARAAEGPVDGARELRHWSSLPASLQVASVEVPPDAESVDLVFLTPDGTEAVRETIDLAEEWTAGRVFVVRRMP